MLNRMTISFLNSGLVHPIKLKSVKRNFLNYWKKNVVQQIKSIKLNWFFGEKIRWFKYEVCLIWSSKLYEKSKIGLEIKERRVGKIIVSSLCYSLILNILILSRVFIILTPINYKLTPINYILTPLL
jgi:hypothetical protein